MTNHISQTDLIELVKTKKDALSILDKLVTIEEGAYNLKQSFTQQLEQTFSEKQKDRILLLCKKQQVHLDNKGHTGVFLRVLQNQIKTLPTVTITIAFSPSDQFIIDLSEWFLANLGRVVLLDIVVDSTIIAGAVISLSGIWTDYSLRKKHEEHFTPETFHLL